jgi:ribonucleoside-diphosphate reductase beta chain
VLGLGGDMEQRLLEARHHVTAAFVEMFDDVLVEGNRRLIEDPTDVEAKIDFVVLYHMVIEGTLALTGQYFITEYMEKHGVLPGFVEGFKLISRDEHRHVAYGTWFLQQKATDPALRQRMADRLMQLIPLAAGVLVPPGADPNNYEILGYSNEETNTFAFNALTRRLKVIGIDLTQATAEAAA